MKAFIAILVFLQFNAVIPGHIDHFPARMRKMAARSLGLPSVSIVKSLLKNPAAEGNYYLVFSDTDSLTRGIIYCGRVYTCDSNGCNRDFPLTGAIMEYFDFFMVLDDKGRIAHIEVTDYRATHGDAVCSRGWLKQFLGYGPGEVVIYGREVDAITGATRSGQSLTNEINQVLSGASSILAEQ